VCGLATIALSQGAFDQQREMLSVATGTHPEDDISEMLVSGMDESKPTQAFALAERWLRQNTVKDPLLLYRAGQAAELAGDWNAAVTLYRQYLQRADLDSDTASDAIAGLYTLLLHQLATPEAAYAFSKVGGHRLVVNHRARQFDRWFLDEAKRRGDKDAVAKRLLALVDAEIDNDQLIAVYEVDFLWLLRAINDGRLDQSPYSATFVESVKALAQSISFDKELALLLDWAVSVKTYNMSILSGNRAAAPIAEAKALLSAYPSYAERVQTDWAGSRGRYYRGDHRQYWPLELDAKLAPVNEAAAQLGSMDRLLYDRSWSAGYYESGPTLLDAQSAREWVNANPAKANQRTAPTLSFDWRNITKAEADALAPHLAKNPSPEAAGVRALASVENIAEELDKAVAYLLKQEAWRLKASELPGYIDRLWHHAGKPDGNTKRDQLIALAEPLQKQYQASLVDREDPATKRLDAFRKFWKDYRSDQPRLTGVRQRLLHTIRVTPEAMEIVLRDKSVEAQLVARDAIEAGFESSDSKLQELYRFAKLSSQRYGPSIELLANRYRGYSDLKKRTPELYRPHPLHAALESALSQQLKQEEVQSWLVLAWINATFVEKDDATLALMRDLMKSPSWKDMPYEVRFAARAWFKETALTPAQFAIVEAADPNLICQPMFEIDEETDARTVAAALETTIERLDQSPVYHEIDGLERLGRVKREVLSDPRVLEQLFELAGPQRSFATDHAVANHLYDTVVQERHPERLHRLAAFLWRDVEVHHRNLQKMITLADASVDASPSAAHTLARVGLQTIARHERGHTYYNREVDLPRLKAIRGKAAVAMNLVEIPVEPDHPAYPIYQSQNQYLIGNVGTARQLLLANADQLLSIHRQLSVPYLLWALRSTIDSRDEMQQETLAKALRTWVEEVPTSFTVEQRIALDLAYGDIAMQRNMLPEARQIFRRIRTNEAYAASFDRHKATVRLVRVQRIARDFDAALQTLMELDAEKVPRLTTESHFARAEVYYDMQEYLDASDEIAKVLERDPNHADAKLLQGRVHLKRQKLIEATEVELGSTAKQPSLVPGQSLKVTLNDPTLSVSSGSTDIEVVVWATSGDKEYLLLRQFGDQKTKYRGDVRTALAEPTPDDGVLQVVGDDQVYYAYSERFREKMVDLDESRGGPIQVASDAMLMASARKLLSENEQRVADMQRLTQMLDPSRDKDLKRTNPERYAALLAEAERRNERAMLETRVKPGNPIYVRVIDPDRGRTAGIDELPVSVSASSGDIITRVVLRETGTHTGQFEGQIPTAVAQAMAYATSSESGVDPNMVISPKTNYPAWRPVNSSETTHALSIDLNDNVALGRLKIHASEPGARLKKFIVETGLNSEDMTTVAVFPKDIVAIPQPWHPSVVVMNDADRYHNNNDRSVYDLEALQQHVDHGWMTQQYAAGVADNVQGISDAFTPEIPNRVEWKRQNRHKHSHVIYRFRGYFYESSTVTRRFKLDLGNFDMPEMHSSVAHPAQFLLAVNGRAITNADQPNQLEGEITLSPGVHRFEIWATGWDGRIGFGRSATLYANLTDDPQLVRVPDAYFDPATFPVGVLDHRNAPASIEVDDAGERFDVAFTPGSHARLLRVTFIDHEGPVPAVSRMTLHNDAGRAVLPVQQDFTELRKNDLLEILTGDRVVVRYLDDRVVTESAKRHERFLNVSFTDAVIEFADIEPRMQRGAIRPYHETLLRFTLNTRLPIIVRDADMDETPEPDTLTVTVTSDRGETRELKAVETGSSTGVFRTWVTPVAGRTQQPEQIQVTQGGRLSATYLDKDNLRPGVPHERAVSIHHGAFEVPRIEIAHADLVPFEESPVRGQWLGNLNESQQDPYWARQTGRVSNTGELIQTRYTMLQRYLSTDESPDGGLSVVHGRTALVDVIAPHLALGAASSIKVYVQTDDGRGRSGQTTSGLFDVNVPGTLVYSATLGSGSTIQSRALERGGYAATFSPPQGSDDERLRNSRSQGRFRVAIPLITGSPPLRSYADREAFDEASRDTGERYPDGLVAKAGEQIHIGVKYEDANGKTRWATASATVVAMPILDVMREDYRETLTDAHVGEQLFVRVVDPYEDRTAERDEVRVYMQTKSGQKHFATLAETDFNSGIFKGVFQMTFVQAQDKPAGDAHDVRRMGMPVTYGDVVGIRYTDAKDRKTPPHFVAVAKGSDGTIAPFSKRYDDTETAMQTQFAMAESFLELARRHRQLGKEKAAQREFERARQLLANTVAQFNDPDTRSHAEYLLGNLTMEDAEATEDKQLQADRYRAALARYMKVTGSYAETEWAAKAQFKIAVLYERLGEPEIAAQEYVKLAYKHPDSEYLATSMARLGTHFQRKAVAYEREAKPLLANEESQDDVFEGTALKKLAQIEYVKSAQIFERLQQRFPSHALAGTAGLRAGQIYMRAEDLSAAVQALENVFNTESYDGPTLRAEAMYWAGRCRVMQREELIAYSLFKRITYDFPESKWAAYARSQLSSERMLNLDQKLEIERLEAGQ
jgi:TolA-binding protein